MSSLPELGGKWNRTIMRIVLSPPFECQSNLAVLSPGPQPEIPVSVVRSALSRDRVFLFSVGCLTQSGQVLRAGGGNHGANLVSFDVPRGLDRPVPSTSRCRRANMSTRAKGPPPR